MASINQHDYSLMHRRLGCPSDLFLRHNVNRFLLLVSAKESIHGGIHGRQPSDAWLGLRAINLRDVFEQHQLSGNPERRSPQTGIRLFSVYPCRLQLGSASLGSCPTAASPR